MLTRSSAKWPVRTNSTSLCPSIDYGLGLESVIGSSHPRSEDGITTIAFATPIEEFFAREAEAQKLTSGRSKDANRAISAKATVGTVPILRPPPEAQATGLSPSLGGGPLLASRKDPPRRAAHLASDLADKRDRRRIGSVMAQRPLELPQVALFGRLGTRFVNAFAVDQPQLPPASRNTMRKDVTRRDATPRKPGRVDAIQHSGHGFKDGVSLGARQLGPGSAGHHFGDGGWRWDCTHDDCRSPPKHALIENRHALRDPKTNLAQLVEPLPFPDRKTFEDLAGDDVGQPGPPTPPSPAHFNERGEGPARVIPEFCPPHRPPDMAWPGTLAGTKNRVQTFQSMPTQNAFRRGGVEMSQKAPSHEAKTPCE